jgi:hypothetical protein
MDRFAISTATAQKIEEVTISMPKKLSRRQNRRGG